jgi:hypothetical protein
VTALLSAETVTIVAAAADRRVMNCILASNDRFERRQIAGNWRCVEGMTAEHLKE